MRIAIVCSEERLRERIRPAVAEALESSGLHPRHRVEEVARDKLVEEFVDGIVLKGFARMGDLRDTLSRNQLKLHDLASAGTFFHGDQFLQIDQNLSKPLDGVYHAGEAYLRLFQRISSLLFGTPLGRLFTYYFLVPYGGAFLLLEVLGHTVGKLYAGLVGTYIQFDDPLTREGLLALLSLGSILLAVVNSEAVRQAMRLSAKATYKAANRVIRWRGWKWCRRLAGMIMASPTWRALVRYGLKPTVVTWLAWHWLAGEVSLAARIVILAFIYGMACIILNSRIFRAATHMAAHVVVVLWGRIIGGLFTGLFRAVVRAFHVLLERLERTLYAVDEWFRFRGGQSRLLLLTKASLGAAWAVLAYWLRFGVTLLAEPQINPIKHFPVVTVSHKIILPTVPHMAWGLESLGLGKVQATTYATTTAFLIPGVFGFLAWELKENWRLYAANRPKTLRPVRMGNHAETMAQLLRLGIHSGTIPRTFARLRRALLNEASRRAKTSAARHQRSLDRVAESVRQFLHREFAGLLNRHPVYADTPIAISAVDLAATRVRATLDCPSRGQSARLSFEQHDGWIVAGIDEAGWMADLGRDEGWLLSLALVGLYQMAGVDLVRQQIDTLFASAGANWLIRGTCMIVRFGASLDDHVRYSLKEDGEPAVAQNEALIVVPAGAVPALLLRRKPVFWASWKRLWDLPVDQWDESLIRVAQGAAITLPPVTATPQVWPAG